MLTADFTKEEIKKFQHRFEEGYDIPDPQYECWLALNHPDAELPSRNPGSHPPVKTVPTESGGARRCWDTTGKNQAVDPAQKACFAGSSSACKFYKFVEREGVTKL